MSFRFDRFLHGPRSVVCTIALVASQASLTACAIQAAPAFRTVPGPENAQVLAPLHGQVAVAEGDRSCTALMDIAVPGASRCVADTRQRGVDFVAGVVPAGPDALLTMRMRRGVAPADPFEVTLRQSRCAAPRPRCEPTQRAIAAWTVPAGGNLYRKPMALSPDGRWLATVPESRLLKLAGYSPRLTSGQRFRDARTVGELVLVDLRSGGQRRTGIELLDEQPISWSADGRRLLVVRAETADRLTPRLAALVEGNEGRAGQGIPVVEALTVETGAVDMLAIGLDPLWSADQSTLLFATADDRFVLRDVGGVERALTLPGMTGRFGPIAFVGPRQVLYWALPTDGTEPAGTVNNSPLVGPKQMVSLKVVDLDTQAFATVVPRIDPRANVGYSVGP